MHVPVTRAHSGSVAPAAAIETVFKIRSVSFTEKQNCYSHIYTLSHSWTTAAVFQWVSAKRY